MKITFIMPSIGRKKNTRYVKTWQMEPVSIAVLSYLTPDSIERSFYDDRIEPINYEEDTDLVAITTETYTAQRSYNIASEFRKRDIPVVIGGFHPTLIPSEAEKYADAIVNGEAESVWKEVLDDVKKGKLKKRYKSDKRPSLKDVILDRSIFKRKKYLPLTLIETGRGCIFDCNFCSISAFYNRTYNYRPINKIVEEIGLQSRKNIFFIDDNIVINQKYSKELFNALIPLKKQWVSQISINTACNESIVSLMEKSGCKGVLIGFESLNSDNLKDMNKKINMNNNIYQRGLSVLHNYGITVYGTFIFGYDYDSDDLFDYSLEFTIKHNFFLAAFNHLVPFPGTKIYNQFKKEKRLLYDSWWLQKGYKFGNVVFKPKNYTAEQLTERCREYRKKFYSYSSIYKRAMSIRTNLRSLPMALVYFIQNFTAHFEVDLKQNLPLGEMN